jgi:thiosulfate reductase cytochrome b subunit
VSGSRYGWPQVFALLLLGAFVLQALWVIERTPFRRAEAAWAQAGLDQLAGKVLPQDAGTQPVPAAIAAVPIVVAGRVLAPDRLKWLLRLPFVAIGWLLGASIWYVARRLYGNAGGYIALALYCFSPAVFFPWPGPLLTGSLGIFGTVFVAIAAAHTLYAPREAAIYELRSRWRRIVLLGLAIALAAGSGWWAVLLIALGLGFMLYLVPERRVASLGLVLASCAVALVLLLACYGFRAPSLVSALRRASFAPQRGMIASELLRAYLTGIRHAENPVLLVIAAIALAAYFAWKRCRYFGNTAPLLALVVTTGLALVTFADVFVGPFPFRAAPFLYVFAGGVFADLLESRRRKLFGILVVGLLAVYAVVALAALARLPVTALP